MGFLPVCVLKRYGLSRKRTYLLRTRYLAYCTFGCFQKTQCVSETGHFSRFSNGWMNLHCQWSYSFLRYWRWWELRENSHGQYQICLRNFCSVSCNMWNCPHELFNFRTLLHPAVVNRRKTCNHKVVTRIRVPCRYVNQSRVTGRSNYTNSDRIETLLQCMPILMNIGMQIRHEEKKLSL